MYALRPQACGLGQSGIHFRRSPHARVTTITWILVQMFDSSLLKFSHCQTCCHKQHVLDRNANRHPLVNAGDVSRLSGLVGH